MAKQLQVKKIEGIDTGQFDIVGMRQNFTDIEEVANDHEAEINALSRRVPGTISFAVEAVGVTKILSGSAHLDLRIINAYTQIGDSVAKEINIGIIGITNNLRYSDTEKAGKVKIFDVENPDVLFVQDIFVETDSDRKCIVNITFESKER